MAIYGVGAYHSGWDRTTEFLEQGIVGVGWDEEDAPELQLYFRSLKAGDIVYIKAAAFGAPISVKGIGIVTDMEIREIEGLVTCGRNVRWVSRRRFTIERPRERNNVRGNTIYEEFHPAIHREIISQMLQP